MRIKLFGCYIDNLTMEETLQKVDEFIKSKIPRQHVVVNANKVILACKNPHLRDIINTCDLVGVDGVPVIWASRLLGMPLKERINGTDLMEKLISRAAEKKYRLYFLGATEDVIKKFAQKCRERYPNLCIAGFRNGYWDLAQEEEIAETIHDAKPDILFIGFSSPKKEIFLKKYLKRMGVPFVMGVGGSFDVAAGLIERAPVWMQKNGLEWLFRFIKEPGRLWKRYLIGNMVFIFLVFGEFIRLRILRRN